MQMYDIIYAKRVGKELTREQIHFFVDGYVNGTIPDYQAAALCMAICINGMTDEETAILTEIMMNSGETVDLSCFGDLSADKHSTGGVGDKTSLVVAPIVASVGGKVAKMSGRGLGHTGGTIDKLESIPGYRTSLSSEEFLSQTEKIGIAMIGQTAELVPADKKLYALRDVTATIDSIPLITSSIMSKKLAAGAHNIVLDVKTGSGAFMKTCDDAVELAEKMVAIGKRCGRNMAALVTNMDSPLGMCIGNSLEVIEAVGVLKGEIQGELREVCLSLAAQMISLIKKITPEEAELLALNALYSGEAFRKMKEWISAQGGDVSYIETVSNFPTAAFSFVVPALKNGYIVHMDAESFGKVSVILGAGRKEKDDIIDHAAGIVLHKTTGDAVQCGEALCTLYSNNMENFKQASEIINAALIYGDTPPVKIPHIYKIIR